MTKLKHKNILQLNIYQLKSLIDMIKLCQNKDYKLLKILNRYYYRQAKKEKIIILDMIKNRKYKTYVKTKKDSFKSLTILPKNDIL